MGVKAENSCTFPIFSCSGAFHGTQYIPFHYHPCPELIYVEDGQCIVMVGYNEFDLHKGDLLIIPAGKRHDQSNLSATDCLFVTMTSSDQIFNIPTGRKICFGDDEAIRMLMALVRKLTDDLNFTACGGLLHTLLQYINDFERKPAAHNGYLNQVVSRMEREYARNLTVASLAEGVRLSESHLRSLFHREFGISVAAYLQNIRMAHARRLLHQPYNNIKEIAFMCGYADNAYFSRLFRKIHLCTPLEYRNRCYQDPESPWSRSQMYVRQ